MLKEMFTAIGTLLLIAAFLYVVYLSSKKIGGLGAVRGQARYMKLMDRLPVGNDRQLMIVKTGDSYLLLGATASQITVLQKLDDIEEIGDVPAAPPELPDFAKLLSKYKWGKRS